MALVTPASRTANLGSHHAVAAVSNELQLVLCEGGREAQPAGAALEFFGCGEKGQTAELAAVRAGLLVVEQDAAEGCLGPVL
jgi:hypothetical protein